MSQSKRTIETQTVDNCKSSPTMPTCSADKQLRPPTSQNPSIAFSDVPYNQIICGDALEVLRRMPSESIDLIVTSPPYNLKNSTGNGMKAGTKTGRWANNPLQNGYPHHNDEMPHDEYVAWQRDCLTEAMRLLKDTGAIFYNHKWRVQGGLIQDRQDIVSGFPVRQIIIWKRAGGFNFNPGYFVPTYEVIYLIAKPKFKLVKGANGYGDIWEFNQEMKNKHPAPFPVALPYRCIESTSAEIILDPFSGSGSTAIAAKQLGRKYIGIEISPEYCKMAEERLAALRDTPPKQQALIPDFSVQHEQQSLLPDEQK